MLCILPQFFKNSTGDDPTQHSPFARQGGSERYRICPTSSSHSSHRARIKIQVSVSFPAFLPSTHRLRVPGPRPEAFFRKYVSLDGNISWEYTKSNTYNKSHLYPQVEHKNYPELSDSRLNRLEQELDFLPDALLKPKKINQNSTAFYPLLSTAAPTAWHNS